MAAKRVLAGNDVNGDWPMSYDPAFCNENVAKKVEYEFNMIHFLAAEISKHCESIEALSPGQTNIVGTGHADDDEMRVSAFVESFLLHTRVLRDFFYKPRDMNDARDDSVTAGDFLDNWSGLRPSEPASIKSRRGHLNKALAHLSKKRIEYDNQKKWNISTIYKNLVELIVFFKNNLSEERKKWFTQQL